MVYSRYESASLQRLGFESKNESSRRRKERKKKIVLNASDIRDKIRTGSREDDEDDNVEESKPQKQQRKLSLVSRKKNAISNKAMNVIMKRFQYYCEDGEVAMSKRGFRRLLKDVANRKITTHEFETLFGEADTHGTGEVSYDEFLSFVSFTRKDLFEKASELKEELKQNSGKKGMQQLFGMLADAKSSRVDCHKLQDYLERRLSIHLTPGELNCVAQFIGPDVSSFKNFMKSRKKWNNNLCDGVAGYIVDFELCGCKAYKDAIVLSKKGYTLVPGNLNETRKTKGVSLWVKHFVEKTSENGEDSEEDSEDETSSEDSAEEKVSDTESDSENDADTERKARKQAGSKRGNVLASINDNPPPIVQFNIGHENRDAHLVAEGFTCMDAAIYPKATSVNRKPLYLWYKKHEEHDLSVRQAELNSIVEMAVTSGNPNDMLSKVWCPPSRGFKRFEHNFGTERNSIYIWYRKGDVSYTVEKKARGKHVDHEKSSSVVFGNTLEKRIRGIVRQKVIQRQRESKNGQLFNMETLFEGATQSTNFLTKKDFVRILDTLGLQLPGKDLALIFDKLDITGSNKVHKHDVIEFFEFSDKELEGIMVQIQNYLRQEKKKGATVLELFTKLDKDGDGRLSGSEFNKLLQRMKIVVAPGELQRLIDIIDTDESGYVDAKEFIDFVKRSVNISEKEHTKIKNRKPAAVKINLNVRNAARTLHKYATEKSKLGNSSGRISSQPDFLYAWDQVLRSGRKMVTVDDEELEVLDAKHLKQFLKKRDLRIRAEDAETLLRTIEPGYEKYGGLTYAGFESFVSTQQMCLEDESNLSKKSKAKRTESLYMRAIRALHADLNAIAAEHENDPEAVFEVLFGKRTDGRVSTSRFFKCLSRCVNLRAFQEKNIQAQLLAEFDRDNDGYISRRDLKRFINSKSPGQKKSEQKLRDFDVSSGDSGSSASSSDESDVDIPSNGKVSSKRLLRGEKGSSKIGGKQSWWLSDEGQSKSKKNLSKEDDMLNDFDDKYVTKLFENDVRRRWIQYIGGAERGDPGVPAQYNNRGPIDVNAIKSAVEEAVRANGGPLCLAKRFTKQDPTGCGYISKKAFHKVMVKSHLNVPVSEHKSLEKALVCASGVHHGKVDYHLFCDFVKDSSEIEPSNFRNLHKRIVQAFEGLDYMFVFEGFDTSGDGTVQKGDFKKALKLLDIRISSYDWKILKPRIQTGNSRIDYQALRELLECPIAATADLETTSRLNSKQAQVKQKSVFKNLAKYLKAYLIDFPEEGSSLDDTFEAYDLDGLGVMSNVDFVRAMSKLVTRIGVSSLIPDSSIRMLAQHYASPQINGVQQVDYISFCRAFHASSVHVVNEEILLQSFANSVGQTSEKYGMSYLDCMKNRDDENYGFISRYDFRRAVRHDMGIDVPEADLLYLMDLADTQGDGTVDYVCLSNKLSISSSSNTDRLDPSSKQMLRRLKERITSKMPPSFDLRNVFSYYSNGEPFLTSTQLSQLGSSFGLHLPPRFCSGLCEQGRMYLPAFLRMLDQDEEEWDAIAEKCWDSLLRLERQQQSFSEMCSIYEDPESTTRTIRASDFRFCVSNAGLPLSQYEFDLVRNRFRNEKCGTIDYLGFVEFVRCRSLQLVSF